MNLNLLINTALISFYRQKEGLVQNSQLQILNLLSQRCMLFFFFFNQKHFLSASIKLTSYFTYKHRCSVQCLSYDQISFCTNCCTIASCLGTLRQENISDSHKIHPIFPTKIVLKSERITFCFVF